PSSAPCPYTTLFRSRIIALPEPVTLAILPHTQAAKALASEAAIAGKTVILHQPMENGAALAIGSGGLYVGMERAELEQTLQTNLDRKSTRLNSSHVS